MKTSCMTSTSKNSDEALVAATKLGDTLAFEELVLRHKQRVFAVAQRITNNREDAEDVAQESFHKAFLHLDAFQEKSRFSTWLTRIAMNEAFMLLRRRRGFLEVLPESPDDGVESGSEAFVDRNPNPEESCWRRERTQLLTEAINRLGPTILGASITAVKARVFQGRRKLRESMHRGLLQEICEPGRAQEQLC